MATEPASNVDFWTAKFDRSIAHSDKPRVVWGSGRLRGPLSRFEGLLLAGDRGYEPLVGGPIE
jgi:hypothetical protein